MFLLTVQFFYPRPGAHLCGIPVATDIVCFTCSDSQGVESLPLRSPETGVSVRLLPHYCVVVCVYFVFVKFIGHSQLQSVSLSPYSSVANYQGSIFDTLCRYIHVLPADKI